LFAAEVLSILKMDLLSTAEVSSPIQECLENSVGQHGHISTLWDFMILDPWNGSFLIQKYRTLILIKQIGNIHWTNSELPKDK